MTKSCVSDHLATSTFFCLNFIRLGWSVVSLEEEPTWYLGQCKVNEYQTIYYIWLKTLFFNDLEKTNNKFLELNYHRWTKVMNKELGDSSSTLRSKKVSKMRRSTGRALENVQIPIISMERCVVISKQSSVLLRDQWRVKIMLHPCNT